MNKSVADQTFDKCNFNEVSFEKGEYENCIFRNCDFSTINLNEVLFIDCQFTDCNLSMATISRTAFRDVAFRACKMLGLRFDQSHEFGLSMSFDHCVLNHSSFFKVKLKNAGITGCQLQEVDFTESDLTGATLDGCDLQGAIFDHTILEKTDFRTASNYSIDPEKNKIKKAKFSFPDVIGLLSKYSIDIELPGKR